MSFEMKTSIDPEGNESEIAEETIVKSHTTRKLWTEAQLTSTIADLNAQITELQERKAVLEEQAKKFKEIPT